MTDAPTRTRFGKWIWIGIAIGAIGILIEAFAIVRSFNSRKAVDNTPQPAAQAFQSMQIRPITSFGEFLGIALSPDGRPLVAGRHCDRHECR